ncbi:MAG: hypothetical protein ACP5O1_07180 [Phycisphaerae bacterium]
MHCSFRRRAQFFSVEDAEPTATSRRRFFPISVRIANGALSASAIKTSLSAKGGRQRLAADIALKFYFAVKSKRLFFLIFVRRNVTQFSTAWFDRHAAFAFIDIDVVAGFDTEFTAHPDRDGNLAMLVDFWHLGAPYKSLQLKPCSNCTETLCKGQMKIK